MLWVITAMLLAADICSHKIINVKFLLYIFRISWLVAILGMIAFAGYLSTEIFNKAILLETTTKLRNVKVRDLQVR